MESWRAPMRCPECDHRVAPEKERCVYCGAVLKVVSSVPGDGSSELREQRQDKVRVEERTYTSLSPELETDQGDSATELDFTPSTEKGLEDTPWQFSMEGTGQRKPMGRFVLVMIFFASAALMGLIILLMG